MPHMNGFEMLAHLASAEFGRPGLIIATSSYSASEIAALGRIPEGVSFVSKPIDQDALSSLLHSAAPAFAGGASSNAASPSPA